MKFKNFDASDYRFIEQIQNTVENSCDRKFRRILINKKRKSVGYYKLHFVGKNSGLAKKFSVFRHSLENKQNRVIFNIQKSEIINEATLRDSMYNCKIKEMRKNRKQKADKFTCLT